MAAQTIVERVQERVKKHPDRVALRYKKSGAWTDVTWGDYGDVVRRAGKSLMALDYKHGDKIALLSNNRPTWHIVDFASMCLGGSTAAVYQTNSPEQVAYIVD